MISLIEIIRIPEALEQYRKNGLPFYKYYLYKNHSLKNFIPCFLKIFCNKSKYDISYIALIIILFRNLIYLNVYLSPFYFLNRKIKLYMSKILRWLNHLVINETLTNLLKNNKKIYYLNIIIKVASFISKNFIIMLNVEIKM